MNGIKDAPNLYSEEEVLKEQVLIFPKMFHNHSH